MRDLFPKNVKCKSCVNLSDHWCDQVDDSPDEEMLRDCQYFCQMTNADRIRAMRDEELAKFIAPESPGNRVWCDPVGKTKCGKAPCKKCVLKWLQSPAEEE